MDGYAVSCADLKTGVGCRQSDAPRPGAPGRLCSNSAHRIMTGAPVPDGPTPSSRKKTLQRGSMLQIGAVLPSKQCAATAARNPHRQRLSPKGHAGLASYRCPRRKVCSTFRCCGPRVTLLSSGRRARGPVRVSHPQIHDSNSDAGRTAACGGAVVRTIGRRETTGRDAVVAPACGHRRGFVLTTAGISVGEEDYVATLARLGAELAVPRSR